MKDLLTIQDEIRQYILKASYADEEQIKDKTLIFEQGLMDSMGFMSLISFLEETFSVQMKDNDLVERNFESIEAISNFICLKLNHK